MGGLRETTRTVHKTVLSASQPYQHDKEGRHWQIRDAFRHAPGEDGIELCELSAVHRIEPSRRGI